MTGAMYAAVSGLKTHMSAMNVIGNNISNVNTLGYKATRYTFNEALYTSVRAGSDGNDQMGGNNPAQIGYGCSVGTIDLDMSTKNYNPTGRGLDCMVDGDGFFIVGDDKQNTGITTQTQLQGMSLSRLGNFEFDSKGYLVDGNGSLVYGFLRMTSMDESVNGTDSTEEEMTSPILTPIRLPMCYIGAASSSEDSTTGTTGTTGTSTGESQSTSKIKTTIVWPQISGSGSDISVEDGTVASYNAAHSGSGGSNNSSSESSTLPEDATLSRLQPNTVAIDKTGCITAMTKDEQLVVVGYVALGTVDNPNGVTHVDGRYYQALGGAGNLHLTTVGGGFTYLPGSESADTPNSGTGTDDTLNLGTSNLTVESAGDTQLVTGGLESSGTDLAQEITNMIVIQRGYQANTRIVTVTDSMLEELVNMKR